MRRSKVMLLLAFVMTMACLTQLMGCVGSNEPSVAPNTGSSSSTTPGGTPASNDGLTFTVPLGASKTPTTITFTTLGSPAANGTWTGTTLPTLDTACATFIKGFTVTATGSITTFDAPIGVGGNVPTSIPAGTTLVLAMANNNAWVDVATITVGAGGLLTENLTSITLPGIVATGTYVLYQPQIGCQTAVSNLGVVFIADDGASSGNPLNPTHSIQAITIFDKQGQPLATPTIKFMNYSTATDLDGQALTPDGSQGIAVDGGNTLRFFSRNKTTGDFVKSSVTLDVSAAGGDGDSVAIMPNGDEAVVSADSSSLLLLVSGINSGAPKAAANITIPGNRDGVVISNDGKVLLARGSSGLTVFSIASVTPAAGPLGGTVSHSFTQKADLTAMGNHYTSGDGREGMAFSPTDSSRAVVIGSTAADITLLTNLTTTPTAGTTLTLSGVNSVYSVSVTPDGKTAIVGTNAGLVMVSGVATGTLTQVGTPFAPSFTNGSSLTLGNVNTLGVTLDGKYVVICAAQPSYSNGTLLVIPITSTGFLAPVGQLNGVAVPYNDQLLIH